MKIALIALTLVSFSAFAEDNSNLGIQAKIKAEVAKDAAGEKSCFNGAVKAKINEMEENYGGRYGGSYEVATQSVYETTYRYTTKYCSEYLDKDFKVLDESEGNDELIVYRRCENADINKSIATITFGASTSGTFEQEGLVFGVDLIVNNDYIVVKDAGYRAEDHEIVKYTQTETLSCKLIEL